MTVLDAFLGNTVAIACPSCGLNFSVPATWHADRLKKRDTFCCPNGHDLYFDGPSAEDRLKRELAAKEQELQRARERADRADRRRAAAQGRVTRMKRASEVAR